MLFITGTPARCNRCNKSFPLPRNRAGDPENDKAYRLHNFSECPVCGQTDCHWVYVADLEKTRIFRGRYYTNSDGQYEMAVRAASYDEAVRIIESQDDFDCWQSKPWEVVEK